MQSHSDPPLAPRPLIRSRSLVPVKLTRFEWSVLLAVLEVASHGTESDDNWTWVLAPEIGRLRSDIADQAGVRLDEVAGGMAQVAGDPAGLSAEGEGANNGG